MRGWAMVGVLTITENVYEHMSLLMPQTCTCVWTLLLNGWVQNVRGLISTMAPAFAPSTCPCVMTLPLLAMTNQYHGKLTTAITAAIT